MIIALAGGEEVARLVPHDCLWVSYVPDWGELTSSLESHLSQLGKFPGVEFVFVP